MTDPKRLPVLYLIPDVLDDAAQDVTLYTASYQMPALSTLPTPATTDCAARVEWAGERIADLCDGTLDLSYAPMIVAYLLGWADLCSADERRQYTELARRVSELREAA